MNPTSKGAKMDKVRIVQRTSPDGSIKFVIQQKHFLFSWWWVDAWVNSFCGAYCTDSFGSLAEAKRNLCYFDGTPSKDIVIDLEGGEK